MFRIKPEIRALIFSRRTMLVLAWIDGAGGKRIPLRLVRLTVAMSRRFCTPYGD